MTQIPQRSPEWFAQRRKRVTGSNVGAVLGHDPWRTRNDVMRAMVRDALGAPSEFADGNPATRYGTANETNARYDFEMESGLKTTEAPFVPYEDWLGASPDAYVGEDALLEIKCPYGLRSAPEPVFKALAEQPHYYAQCQVQLFVTSRDKCHFYQWTPHGSHWTVVHVDHTWRDENLPRLRQFYAEFLAELENPDEHLQPRRVSLDTPEAHRMVREWDDLCEQEDWVAERKKELLAQIVESAGEKNAEFAGRKLTRIERAGSVSYAKVVKEHCPSVDLSKYTGKPTAYWKLS